MAKASARTDRIGRDPSARARSRHARPSKSGSTRPPARASLPRMERIEIDAGGERFVAIACGAGPLALFLHGFPDVPATWAGVMERLASDHRCVAPYLRGYAPSPTRGPFDLDRLGADVVAIARALSREPAVVLGHDWGALAAYAAIAREPARFSAVVAVSVPHPAALARTAWRHPSQLARSAYVGFFQLPRLPELALSRGLWARLYRAWSPGFEAPEAHLAEVERTLAASGSAPLGLYRALPRSLRAQVPAWPRPRVPTLYLHGLDDGCIAPELARGQERVFEGPHRTELVVAGHFVPLEAPARVAELARAFVRAHAA